MGDGVPGPRPQDALATTDAAVDAGLDTTPDPLRTEILMRANRIAEAEPIWACAATLSLVDGSQQ